MSEINSKSTAQTNQQQIINVPKTMRRNGLVTIVNIIIIFIQMFISFFVLTVVTSLYFTAYPPAQNTVLDCSTELGKKTCNINTVADTLNNTFIAILTLVIICNIIYFFIKKKSIFIAYKIYFEK